MATDTLLSDKLSDKFEKQLVSCMKDLQCAATGMSANWVDSVETSIYLMQSNTTKALMSLKQSLINACLTGSIKNTFYKLHKAEIYCKVLLNYCTDALNW